MNTSMPENEKGADQSCGCKAPVEERNTSCCGGGNEGKNSSCCGGGASTSCCGGGGSCKIGKFFFLLVVIGIAVAIVFSKKESTTTQPEPNVSLPTMIELGSEKCAPCLAMKPIVADLQKNYSGSVNVLFYNVTNKPEMGEKFQAQIIPVQIFLDKDGKEIFRHEGFFAKEDILAKWQELGYAIVPNQE